MCLCVRVVCIWAREPVEAERRHEILWVWSHSAVSHLTWVLATQEEQEAQLPRPYADFKKYLFIAK